MDFQETWFQLDFFCVFVFTGEQIQNWGGKASFDGNYKFVWFLLWLALKVMSWWQEEKHLSLSYVLFFFYFSQAQIQSKNKFLVWFRHGQLHFAKNQNTKLSRIHLILWEWKVRYPVVFIQFFPIFPRLNITSTLYQ